MLKQENFKVKVICSIRNAQLENGLEERMLQNKPN
jgi:hypothetical protein